MSDEPFVLLYGIEDYIFKSLYGEDHEWPCKLVNLPEDCSFFTFLDVLRRPGLRSVVVQDTELVSNLESYYYESRGLIVFFGHYGAPRDIEELSSSFGLDWKFSAYTRHGYVLTENGKSVLGDAISDVEYSKSNLLSVPVEDRILVPKSPYATVDDYISDNGPYGPDGSNDVTKGRIEYENYLETLGQEVPLAMHTASHGGRIAYLGFVNDNGNIPKLVRALCSGVKTTLE